MAKLELLIMAGAESKQFLSELTKQIDRLEKLKGLDDKTADTDDAKDCVSTEETEEEDDFASKKKPAKKKAASFDDDEEEATTEETEESEETEEGESEEEEPPKKAGKAKKLTSEDCNDAAKAVASKHGRSFVLDLMKKKFKTQSVSELKPDQYEDFVTVMKKAESSK